MTTLPSFPEVENLVTLLLAVATVRISVMQLAWIVSRIVPSEMIITGVFVSFVCFMYHISSYVIDPIT